MKEKLIAFVHGLMIYDYILFATVLTLFILFIVLAIVLRNRVGLSIFLVLFAFAIITLGPTVGYIEMHKYLFKNSLELISQKRLSFVEAVVVKGKLTNESERNFSECKITAGAYKVTKNKYKNYIYKLKPFKKMSIVKRDIPKGATVDFKIIVEPFRYKKDYNITLGASCR